MKKRKVSIKKLAERLLLFFIGVPGTLSICYFLPQYNFLALHICILLVITIGAMETRTLLSHKFHVYSRSFFIFIAIIPIIATYLYGANLITAHILFLIIFSLILITFIHDVIFTNSNKFEERLEKLISAIFILIYPVYLGLFLSLLTTLKYANIAITCFLLTIFLCDSAAWLFGHLFGNGNRGVFKASPNKSIAGFIGGIANGIALAFLAYFFVSPFNQSLWKTMLLFLLTTGAAIVGDLLESIFKRSVNVKDSGQIILGRGGMLDTIDSIIFAAPVFYFLFRFLFK
ncbi:MAG: phosphatidate cytidylyltransferase [Treponema sp.]|nr:MAG: phosphatidate cytidylyltransferase [Treponema sp.]